MPQSKWERGFWASVRGGGTGIFKPYPPEHWRKPKTNRKKKSQISLKNNKNLNLKRAKSDFLKKHVKVVTIPDIGKELTLFDSF